MRDLHRRFWFMKFLSPVARARDDFHLGAIRFNKMLCDVFLTAFSFDIFSTLIHEFN